jgi:hypothetical protein
MNALRALILSSLRSCHRSMKPAAPPVDPIAAYWRYWLARGTGTGWRYL